ncbi:MAG: hypothetical protein JWM31_960, partial [Solirubrobacterales bacterium]|nr:hypothetical protein [Solirubrobacterales bacterium]
MRSSRGVLAAAVSALLLSGCGGAAGSGANSPKGGTGKAKAPIEATAPVKEQKSLLGGGATAGNAESYTPTGDIVADSGFRPDVDGFGFENYGNDAGPVNLRAANVEHLFGDQVCAIGTG